MKNDKTLKRWFREYNKRYFDNALPNATIFWEPAFVTTEDLGEIWEKAPGVFIVRIDPAVKFCGDFTRIILLHEMMHLRLWPYRDHGEKFQAEKARLIFLGAYRKLL